MRRIASRLPCCLLVSCLVGGVSLARTVRDEFTAVAYNGNNGSVNWDISWQEQGGEADGPSNGTSRVVSNSRCAAGNCMRIGAAATDITGRGLLREADLAGAVSATLTFSYRR